MKTKNFNVNKFCIIISIVSVILSIGIIVACYFVGANTDTDLDLSKVETTTESAEKTTTSKDNSTTKADETTKAKETTTSKKKSYDNLIDAVVDNNDEVYFGYSSTDDSGATNVIMWNIIVKSKDNVKSRHIYLNYSQNELLVDDSSYDESMMNWKFIEKSSGDLQLKCTEDGNTAVFDVEFDDNYKIVSLTSPDGEMESYTELADESYVNDFKNKVEGVNNEKLHKLR